MENLIASLACCSIESLGWFASVSKISLRQSPIVITTLLRLVNPFFGKFPEISITVAE
jgi:hypothetical protein